MEKYIPIFIAGLSVFLFVSVTLLTTKKKPSTMTPEGPSKRQDVRIAPYYHVSLVVAVALFFGILAFFPVSATLKTLVLEGEGAEKLVRAFIFGISLFLAFLFSLLKRNLD